MRWHAPPAGTPGGPGRSCTPLQQAGPCGLGPQGPVRAACYNPARSEEHTSELQSPCNLVCRLLLEKKKKNVICLTDLLFPLVYNPLLVFVCIYSPTRRLDPATTPRPLSTVHSPVISSAHSSDDAPS